MITTKQVWSTNLVDLQVIKIYQHMFVENIVASCMWQIYNCFLVVPVIHISRLIAEHKYTIVLFCFVLYQGPHSSPFKYYTYLKVKIEKLNNKIILLGSMNTY